MKNSPKRTNSEHLPNHGANSLMPVLYWAQNLTSSEKLSQVAEHRLEEKSWINTADQYLATEEI